MLYMIPAPLHRQALRIAHDLRKYWWRWARPTVIGCRVLAFDQAGRLLLIRHSYGRRYWMPPGGGMRRGEDPLIAAAREFGEEVGCALLAPFIIDIVEESLQGAPSIVHIVAGGVSGTPVPDGREIAAAAFFTEDELPQDMPMAMKARMPEWITAVKAARHPDAGTDPAIPQEQTG